MKCLWNLCGRSEQASPQRILPDGSVELVLHFSGRFRRHEVGSAPVTQPRALVVGIVDRWVMLESTGDLDVLGVRFHPGAVGGVLGISQARLAGGWHDLDSLEIPPLRGFWREVRAEPERRRRVAVVWRRLAEAAACAPPPPPLVLATARRIVSTAGTVPIGAIAREAGWSLGHLERRFRRGVGATPKEFARLSRFRGVVARLNRTAPPQWSRLAARSGYHDQPHLVREFKEFGGTTPGAYWRETHPLSDLFHAPVEFLQDEPGVPA